jgi:hypothetical protein
MEDVELEPNRTRRDDLPLGAITWLAFTVIAGCCTLLWWTFAQ